ncbi:MAG: permease [Rubritepida sp.]|nr:permease [Rubritepida sp.]
MMDGIALPDLTMFLAATFLASALAGLAGFAFGLLAAAFWLHILSPLQTTTLIVMFGLIVQGVSVWRVRRALSVARLWPFLVGAVLGVPIGVEFLRGGDPSLIRRGVGIVLLLFSFYAMARPRPGGVAAGGRAADGAVGLLSGVLGGATGLAGILPVVWCNLRGWPKDEQRAVFQTVAVAIFVATALWLRVEGSIAEDTVWLAVIGLPAVLAGTWTGLRLYGRLDDAAFRYAVLALLALSGVVLMW